jgi:hypothetical protein
VSGGENSSLRSVGMWSSTIAIEKLLLVLSSAIATSTASASSWSVGVTWHWGNDEGTDIADVFRLVMVVQAGGWRACTLLPNARLATLDLDSRSIVPNPPPPG